MSTLTREPEQVALDSPAPPSGPPPQSEPPRRRRPHPLAVIAGIALAGGALVGLLFAITSGSSEPSAPTAKPVAARPAAPAAKPAATATTPGARIAVSLTEFKVTPSSTVGKAGRITFTVRNSGQVPHEFVVLKTAKPAGSLLKGARADESGNVGETGDLIPGAQKSLSLKLAAGHYALICNLPGHYKAGQHIDFQVR